MIDWISTISFLLVISIIIFAVWFYVRKEKSNKNKIEKFALQNGFTVDNQHLVRRDMEINYSLDHNSIFASGYILNIKLFQVLPFKFIIGAKGGFSRKIKLQQFKSLNNSTLSSEEFKRSHLYAMLELIFQLNNYHTYTASNFHDILSISLRTKFTSESIKKTLEILIDYMENHQKEEYWVSLA